MTSRYSREAYNEFFLNDFIGRPQDLKNAILDTNYVGGYTNTADGIRYASDEQFTPLNGDRLDVPNVMIVITDGASNINDGQTVPNAIEARRRGTTVNIKKLWGISSKYILLCIIYFHYLNI